MKSLNYGAYGDVIGENGGIMRAGPRSDSSMPEVFAGAYGIRRDTTTGLDYMRFRWYANDLSSFISADRVRGTNRYAYAKGNPVKYVDPMGLKEQGFPNVYNSPYYEQGQEGPYRPAIAFHHPEDGWPGYFSSNTPAEISYNNLLNKIDYLYYNISFSLSPVLHYQDYQYAINTHNDYINNSEAYNKYINTIIAKADKFKCKKELRKFIKFYLENVYPITTSPSCEDALTKTHKIFAEHGYNRMFNIQEVRVKTTEEYNPYNVLVIQPVDHKPNNYPNYLPNFNDIQNEIVLYPGSHPYRPIWFPSSRNQS